MSEASEVKRPSRLWLILGTEATAESLGLPHSEPHSCSVLRDGVHRWVDLFLVPRFLEGDVGAHSVSLSPRGAGCASRSSALGSP